MYNDSDFYIFISLFFGIVFFVLGIISLCVSLVLYRNNGILKLKIKRKKEDNEELKVKYKKLKGERKWLYWI